jgi:regulator of RNase E activity RraA
MISPITQLQLEALRRIDSCLMANTIESFNVRLRNQGFIDQTVRCLTPQMQPMVGYAATLKIRGSEPPTAADVYPGRTDWWDYIVSLPEPRVVVIQDMETRPCLGALVGRLHINILQALGCVGVITDGAVRNVATAQSQGFNLFAGCVGLSHAYVHIVEIGTPVTIGGLKIQSGDLLHGDVHGVQSIPPGIVPEIPAAASRIDASKREIIALCQSPGFSLEKLRAALSKNSP